MVQPADRASHRATVATARVPKFTPSFEAAAYAARVLRIGDAEGDVDRLIAAQLRAEAAFRERAYAAWPLFPDHPLAPALAALARHEASETVRVARVRGLSWLGALLRLHEDDWRGREEAVAGRLRSPENVLGCVFELEVSVFFRIRGHATRWLWPTAQDEGDVLIDDAVHAECVGGAATSGIRVPAAGGSQLASALLNAMRKHRRDLLVGITTTDTLAPTDVPALRDALCAAVAAGRTGEIPLPIGGYAARIEDLSTGSRPLTDAEIARFVDAHARTAHKWGHVERGEADRAVHRRLVRLQVCRGRRAGAIAGGLADRLGALGVAYERCASVPDAAERDLDVGRAGTFRALAALLRGRDAMEEPGADPRN